MVAKMKLYGGHMSLSSVYFARWWHLCRRVSFFNKL